MFLGKYVLGTFSFRQTKYGMGVNWEKRKTNARPVEGVVEMWEYVDEDVGVVLLEAVSQILKHSKHYVNAVCQV